MEMTLTPDMEETIQHEIAIGRFATPVEVVAAALERMRKEEDYLAEIRNLIEAKLAESEAAMDRGNFIAQDAFEAEMARWRASVQ